MLRQASKKQDFVIHDVFDCGGNLVNETIYLPKLVQLYQLCLLTIRGA